MSKQGMQAAFEYERKLERFPDFESAEEHFTQHRKSSIEYLKELSLLSNIFSMDFSMESLKNIEKWYFELYENDRFPQLGVTRNDFERLMGIYFGEVAVKNCEEAKWAVERFFLSPNKYTFGVTKGLMTIVINNAFIDHYKTPDNKRRQWIYRKCKQSFT